MGWNLRKRVTLVKGVTLNLSKNGISTTFGQKGMSVNVCEKGVHTNLTIPGTGIYRMDKIADFSIDKQKEIIQNENRCEICGTQILEYYIFCKHCGFLLKFPEEYADKSWWF